MHGDHGAWPERAAVFAQEVFERIAGDEPCVRFDVDDGSVGATIKRRVGAGDERDGRYDYQIAGPNTHGLHSQMKRRRARIDGDGFSRTEGLTEPGLELRDRGTLGQPIAAQHARHGLDVILVDDLPSVWQRRRVVHTPAGSGIRSNPSRTRSSRI